METNQDAWNALTPEQQRGLKAEFPEVGIENLRFETDETFRYTCHICDFEGGADQLFIPRNRGTVPICLDRPACLKRKEENDNKFKREREQTNRKIAPKVIPLPAADTDD